jgi:hypothetical protein
MAYTQTEKKEFFQMDWVGSNKNVWHTSIYKYILGNENILLLHTMTFYVGTRYQGNDVCGM